MTGDGVAASGPLGGAANEHGGEFRAGVAAWLMAHAATGRAVPGVGLVGNGAIPVQVRVEVDEAIDDLEATFLSSHRAFVQSKARLTLERTRTTPFGKAVRQWRAQAEEGFEDGDRLVIVTSQASRSVKALAAALDRRRDRLAGHPTRRERNALDVLIEHMEDLEPVLRDRLLDHASLLVLDLDTEGSGDAGVAAELLDSRVVAPGQGRRAFRALRDRFRHQAVLRSGVDLDRMLDGLRDDGLSLVTDAEASAAARRLATRQALERLRATQIKTASEVDLRQLGVAAPPIPAVELAQLPGVDVDATSSRRTNPVSALRRRSRVLLLGPTGSGKSLLLQQLTAQAATDGAIGVLVPLPRVLAVGLDGDPVEVLVRAALADVGYGDRELVAEEIRRAASQGPMHLSLDALDETRSRRFEVVAWVERLVGCLHHDVEVVLATRTSGYAAASTLKFHELRMAPLEHADTIARPVLQALSPDVPPPERRKWIGERLRRVEEAFQQANISPTPLAATVLSLLATQSVPDGLPTGRAELLDELLDRIARSWERRTNRAGRLSGGLTSNETTEALLDAFATIGWTVATTARPTIEQVVARVAEALAPRWQMPAPRAEVFGGEALHFWDEAGIVSIADDGTGVEAGLRVLTELGAARYLVAAEEKAEHIDFLLRDETLHDVVVLATGLSPDVAQGAVEQAIALDTHPGLLAVARGCADGSASPDVIERLVAALLASSRDVDDPVHVGRIVTSLSVPVPQRSAVLDYFCQTLPASHAEIMRALAMTRWQMHGRTADVESVLRAGRPPEDISGEESPRLRAALIDERPITQAYDDLVIEAGRYLDLDRRDTVELLEAVASESPLGLADRLEQVVRARGGSVRRPQRATFLNSDWMRANEAMQRAFVEFLRLLTRLARPRPLGWGERRRLDELARLIGALQLSESHPRDLDTAMEFAFDELNQLVHAVVAAFSFDPELIAGQAAAALGEMNRGASRDEIALLLYDSVEDGRTVEWDRVDVDLLLRLLGATRWIALVAATLLGQGPQEHRAAVAHHVATAAEELGPWHRWLAGNLAVFLDPSNATVCSWTRSDDVLLRSVAAAAAAKRLDTDVLREHLRDGDATVRHGGLMHIEPSTLGSSDRLRVIIESADAEPFQSRTCRWCGTENAPEGEPNCHECGLALPDPHRAIRALLSGRAPSW